ncbi:hypothetical protein MKW98_019934 [Papaver atlanticum]|uniref:Myb/SANT-like domain-containing protein n=1 Tax=Papaver atlanticum TaxID=357466 RepID=A0AAD4S1Z5_9MAGN|nr:hypothetical protein MKW98_019934 [Papaver atlanticum]
MGDYIAKTNWTPSMTRYFIELLKEQVLRAHMTALFKQKFGVQYHTDVLKNRFKTLGRKYDAITTLLNNGFLWDRTRHMVVAAHDNMWNTYIKAHPDARSYRTNSTPFYDDLCVIYGSSPVEDVTVHDEEYMEDDFLIGTLGESPAIERDTAYDIEDSSHADEEAVWQISTEEKEGAEIGFCEVENLVHSSEMPNKQNEKVLSDQGAFATEGSSKVELTRHRKQYLCVRGLLGHGGFEWDKTLQMVKADAHVWDDYIKAHPDARQYRVRPVPHYKDLCIVYGDTYISGRNNNLSGDPVHNVQEDSSYLNSDILNQHNKRLLKTHQSMIDAIQEIRSAVTLLAEKTRETTLRALPDIDEELFLDACDFLEVDAKRAKMFVLLDGSLQKKWLLNFALRRPPNVYYSHEVFCHENKFGQRRHGNG